MAEEILQETWITLSPYFMPAAGVLLVAAGIALLAWSDLIVNLVIALLGVFAVIIGLGFLVAGHLMGRAGILPVLLFIAGFSSILIGILVFLNRDLVFDLIIYLGAAIAVVCGLFLLVIGGLLSVEGWGRRAFLLAGAVLLVAGHSPCPLPDTRHPHPHRCRRGGARGGGLRPPLLHLPPEQGDPAPGIKSARWYAPGPGWRSGHVRDDIPVAGCFRGRSEY